MSTLPQDWPLLDYAICWTAGPSQSPVQSYWCSLSGRTEGSTTVRRGKQYELDQVQPGEMTLTLRNDDGVFDPTNTLSPFYPQVIPYRLIRLRAQYPATVNLLTATQATTLYSETAGQTVTINGFSIAPGLAYTAQALITATGGTPTLTLAWINVAGSVISTVTATGTGTVTVTGTAPATAVGAYLQVSMATGTSYTVTDVQIEQNSTASAFVTPGTWYSLFTGYVERWPQSWSSGGNYGTVALDCVDLCGFLANVPLSYPAYQELLAMGPSWFFPLDDSPAATGITAFNDAAGKFRPAQIITSGAGFGATAAPVTPATTLTSSGGYLPLGIPGPVLGFAQPTATQSYLTGVDLTGGGANPAGPAGSTWTRVIAFRAPNAGAGSVGGVPTLWSTQTQASWLTTGAAITASGVYDSNGNFKTLTINWYSADANVGALAPFVNASLSDGGWHLLVFCQNGNNAVLGWLDGVALNNAATTIPSPSWVWDIVGGPQTNHDGITSNANALLGDIAFVAHLPFVVSSTQASKLYEAFRYAWEWNTSNAESSGTRYARILGWIGYTGPTRIDTGSSVDYGPATDVQGGTNPTYALQALQNVVATEYGQHYVAADGTIVFQGRSDRYNPTSVATFGEHTGEIPYTGAKMDFDPTRVANQIEVDAQYGNAPYYATDATSQSNYGQVGLQWTANSLSPEELQDGAEYLLYQNKQPFQRLEALPVDVGANPSLWASLLPLDLGAAVTVNRRPSAAPADSQVGFVEQISWSIDDQRKVSWTAQVSNAANHYFGKLDDATYGKFDSTLIFGF